MRVNIDTDWRVIQIASELGLTELHVVGCLWKLWTWADQHTLDGNAICVTSVTLDRFTGVTGFANAMRNVGWLTGKEGELCFPNFTEHNGKTAKNRAKTNERVAKHRNAKTVTNVTLESLPEKRREEKRRVIEKERTRGDEFETIWDLWLRHRIEKQKPLGSIEEEQQRYKLVDFSDEDAIAIVRYSIASGALNLITNGDHNRKDIRTGKPSGKKNIMEYVNEQG
jgi:hypothetical protein